MNNTNDNNVKIRKSPRFGVLDFVIILLIIVAVVGIYFRYSIVDIITSSRNLENYTVTFSIENIRYTTPNYIDVGDDVYFASDGSNFGTLINVSENMGALTITPASEHFTTTSGEIVEVFYPNSESRVSAVGRLNCVARYSAESGYLINGSTYISLGEYVNVKTEYVTVTIRIEDIELTADK